MLVEQGKEFPFREKYQAGSFQRLGIGGILAAAENRRFGKSAAGMDDVENPLFALG